MAWRRKWLKLFVFEAIPELEFDQTANLAAEAGHDLGTQTTGADAEPVPELEFDHWIQGGYTLAQLRT